MLAKKFVTTKKTEFAIKEYVKKHLGKGKVSNVKIERTPIGERIVVFTSRPGVVIGRKGEAIQSLTNVLKNQFKLENPKIEIAEITEPQFDAQTIADQIALDLERLGSSVFKRTAYKALERIKAAGALGAEIILSGKLPSEKARPWRFFFGYMKKTGEIDIVNQAQATAQTKPGVVGIKVSVVPKDAIIPDRIKIIKGLKLGAIEEKPKNEEVKAEETEDKKTEPLAEKEVSEEKKEAKSKKEKSESAKSLTNKEDIKKKKKSSKKEKKEE